EDDGAGHDASLSDSLWAEGLATFVSQCLNPSATAESVFMDSILSKTSEKLLPALAKDFHRVKDELVESKTHPKLYGQWFLMHKRPNNLFPTRSGYFLGFYVAKRLNKKYTLDEMARWPFQLAREHVRNTLEDMSHEGGYL